MSKKSFTYDKCQFLALELSEIFIEKHKTLSPSLPTHNLFLNKYTPTSI